MARATPAWNSALDPDVGQGQGCRSSPLSRKPLFREVDIEHSNKSTASNTLFNSRTCSNTMDTRTIHRSFSYFLFFFFFSSFSAFPPLTTACITQTPSSMIPVPRFQVVSLGALTEHPSRTPDPPNAARTNAGCPRVPHVLRGRTARQAMRPARPEWEEPVLARHLDHGLPARYSKQVTEVA
jgi:hypothetical protein